MDRWVTSSVTECVSEPVTWFGQQPLAPGETMAVVSVGVLPGEQWRVAGFDTEPATLTLLIDGAPVVAGAELVGGSFTVVNAVAEPFVLSSVAIDLQRCRQVASMAPAPVVPSSTLIAQTATAGRAEPTMTLPETGTASLALALTATIAVLVGVVLWWVSRRRAH